MGSAILTVASVPGLFGSGYMNFGRLSREEILKELRSYAKYERDKWEKVLAINDHDFNVRIVRGVHKQELIKQL